MAVSLVSTGVQFPDNSTQATAATGFGFKNRIINGAMVINQRNTTITDGGYSVDRWLYSNSVIKQSIAQSSTAPTGFINSLSATTTPAAYSITSTDYFTLGQYIEGLNCSDLAWGTASAATVTLSFWVRSSLTGTFGGSLRNSAADRSYPFTYTISAANTWEQKSITIAGDTSGTWLTTNGIGIRVSFGMGVGSTYSNTAGTWAAGNYLSATGSTSILGTNGATFYITGVQLEKGSTATSFDYRPIGTELALCQRYFEILPSGGNGINGSTANLGYVNWQYKVTKRAAPTVTLGAGSLITAFDYTNEWGCSGYRNGYPVIASSTSASAEL